MRPAAAAPTGAGGRQQEADAAALEPRAPVCVDFLDDAWEVRKRCSTASTGLSPAVACSDEDESETREEAGAAALVQRPPVCVAFLDDAWAARKRCSTASTGLGLAPSDEDEPEGSDRDVLEDSISTTCSVGESLALAPSPRLGPLAEDGGCRARPARAAERAAAPEGVAHEGISAEAAPAVAGAGRGAGRRPGRAGCCLLALACISFGCACQGPYEVLNMRDKGCSHLISLAEHLFGALASLGALRRSRRLPLALHLLLALGSIGYTQLQNAALGTSLPTIVLITMKSGGLVANMLLGSALLKHRYSLRQRCAVLCVSAGLVCTALPGEPAPGDGAQGDVGRGCLAGVALLAGALLCRSAGSILQEAFVGGYAVPADELLLFRNLLGLPVVLSQWRSIEHHAERWSAGPGAFGLAWPGLWGLLAMNVLFDHLCRLAVTHLIERTSSLSANLVLTVQRSVAFLISASLLSTEAVGLHVWLGSALALAGSALYSLVPAGAEAAAAPGPDEGRAKRA